MKSCERRGEAETSGRSASRVAFSAFAALAVSADAQAQAQIAVSVSVDAATVVTPLTPVWSFHGYDEINYTTTPEGRALLATIAAAHSVPVHVRSHFLFNTGDGTPAMKWGSTNVYAENEDKNPIFDWTLTDGIMDAITAAGAFPFVEIGFMPQPLSTRPMPYRNSSTLALDSGCFYPPKDYGKWAALIRAWAAHAKERYGNVESTWLWELWNEPDIGYWHGTFDEYARLYDTTEAALHEVLPNAPLGGPAVALPSGRFLTQFLQHCATGTNAVTGEVGTRLDHVTFHAKGGVSMTDGHVEMNLGNQLRLHRAGFDAVAAVAEFKTTPIYITEADPDGCAACTASIIPGTEYRNSTAYGAYEISMMKHTIELADQMGVKLGGLLTWAFTFPGTPFFAGYRVLATNGIDLPVMGALELLGRLAGVRVSLTSTGARSLSDILSNGMRGDPEVDGLAALDDDTLWVLIWNYHDALVSAEVTPVHATLKVPARFGAQVRMSHLRLDESHGNAHAVWVAQGEPNIPSPAQISALQQAMTPSKLVPDATSSVTTNGTVSVDFQLPRFGISLLTVRPDEQASHDGAVGTTGARDGADTHSGDSCSCRLGSRNDDGNRALALLASLAHVVLLRNRRQRRQRTGIAECRCEKRPA